MRHVVFAGFGLLIVFGNLGVVRADDATSAQAIIDRAIQIQAGSIDKLDALRVLNMRMEGKLSAPNGEVPTTKQVRTVGSDRFRGEFELAISGRRIRTTMIINGEEGWRVEPNGSVIELTVLELSDFREDMYAWSLPTLLPLKEKGNTFTMLPNKLINERTVVGFQVERSGRPTVRMFFDKETGLLVQTSFDGKEAGIKLLKETVYGDYKPFGGIVLPTKVIDYRGGNRAASWTVLGYEMGGKIENQWFSKP